MGRAESVVPAARRRVPSLLFSILIGGLCAVVLWFPSAAAGILIFEALGQQPYLTIRAVALPAMISAVLLIIPLGALAVNAGGWPARRQTYTVVGVVALWQFAWAAIALVTDNETLIAWPSYAVPSEPEPWNAPLVLATGLIAVALLWAGIGVVVARRAGPA